MSKNITPEEKEAMALMNLLHQRQDPPPQSTSSTSNKDKIVITPEFQNQMNTVRKKIEKGEYSGLSKQALHKKLRENVGQINHHYFNLLLKIFFDKQQGGKKKTRKNKKRSTKTKKYRSSKN